MGRVGVVRYYIHVYTQIRKIEVLTTLCTLWLTHAMITKCYNTVVYYHELLQHAFSLLTCYIICVKLYITITIKTYIHLSVTCTV